MCTAKTTLPEISDTLSLCRKIIIASVETLFIAKGRVCFLPTAILLSRVAVYRIVYGFNQAINRINKIAIGRKQTRTFAINKVSNTDFCHRIGIITEVPLLCTTWHRFYTAHALGPPSS